MCMFMCLCVQDPYEHIARLLMKHSVKSQPAGDGTGTASRKGSRRVSLAGVPLSESPQAERRVSLSRETFQHDEKKRVSIPAGLKAAKGRGLPSALCPLPSALCPLPSALCRAVRAPLEASTLSALCPLPSAFCRAVRAPLEASTLSARSKGRSDTA